jgi:hypothetical protein
MVPLLSLWLPVLVAALFVFVASSLLHMLTPWHKGDFAPLPDEDRALDALRELKLAPGDYLFPNAGGDSATLRSAEYQEKVRKGPVGVMTIFPERDPSNMLPQLTQWFLYCVLVSIFAAYIASRAVGPGAEYLPVHRFAGATAFAGYGLALLQRSIWWKQRWSTTLKGVVDALLYGMLTGGVFGWLWP